MCEPVQKRLQEAGLGASFKTLDSSGGCTTNTCSPQTVSQSLTLDLACLDSAILLYLTLHKVRCIVGLRYSLHRNESSLVSGLLIAKVGAR